MAGESRSGKYPGRPGRDSGKETRKPESEEKTLPIHIHLHGDCPGDGKEREEDPCVNININVSQCNYRPDFKTCYGDTVYYMHGMGDNNPPGKEEDPPPAASEVREAREFLRGKECLPVEIHIHRECEDGEREEDPCVNINVNASQCNFRPDFKTCYGDTVYYMHGMGDNNPPGQEEDPPP